MDEGIGGLSAPVPVRSKPITVRSKAAPRRRDEIAELHVRTPGSGDDIVTAQMNHWEGAETRFANET